MGTLERDDYRLLSTLARGEMHEDDLCMQVRGELMTAVRLLEGLERRGLVSVEDGGYWSLTSSGRRALLEEFL